MREEPNFHQSQPAAVPVAPRRHRGRPKAVAAAPADDIILGDAAKATPEPSVAAPAKTRTNPAGAVPTAGDAREMLRIIQESHGIGITVIDANNVVTSINSRFASG